MFGEIECSIGKEIHTSRGDWCHSATTCIKQLMTIKIALGKSRGGVRGVVLFGVFCCFWGVFFPHTHKSEFYTYVMLDITENITGAGDDRDFQTKCPLSSPSISFQHETCIPKQQLESLVMNGLQWLLKCEISHLGALQSRKLRC